MTEKLCSQLEWQVDLPQNWGSGTSSCSSYELLPKWCIRVKLATFWQWVKSSSEVASEGLAVVDICFGSLSDISK